ncbi:hypothetical protein Pst134EA_004632 [Puccinia striiformis f. sp. tritici]|uniref:uncharacterized protein n=1 Tax=Puccinia striiformis f. sp. tritici TaxID=168172 RepID=UPI002007B0C6|nr:uncharacterized protein Pst134EA_032549 [Puccinia striiformis f. sp. tritici]XP_047810164.1 hypothetical protein Pst134EA_004632 [Puccinia striiformis f. sp. tritici]KAI9623007.1 hypothetical protein KEM48_009622 [Puccinia striiformis f. sp. tritici PST-130]KAH9443602.1 hypothetical protein Pst134EA_032549 [Puccinia striiformis f. sp. tritici]KAH9461780.1 hypothetical protein Pst134EB_005701 [Puccinia striiformis f. sp. tritici]KAH9470710.1 hypothetical protein Pst134EA_004632 [Puccinia str
MYGTMSSLRRACMASAAIALIIFASIQRLEAQEPSSRSAHQLVKRVEAPPQRCVKGYKPDWEGAPKLVCTNNEGRNSYCFASKCTVIQDGKEVLASQMILKNCLRNAPGGVTNIPPGAGVDLHVVSIDVSPDENVLYASGHQISRPGHPARPGLDEFTCTWNKPNEWNAATRPWCHHCNYM